MRVTCWSRGWMIELIRLWTRQEHKVGQANLKVRKILCTLGGRGYRECKSTLYSFPQNKLWEIKNLKNIIFCHLRRKMFLTHYQKVQNILKNLTTNLCGCLEFPAAVRFCSGRENTNPDFRAFLSFNGSWICWRCSAKLFLGELLSLSRVFNLAFLNII